MKRFLMLLIAICMMSFFVPTGYATLLVNGDAETGALSPWTTIGSQYSVVDGSPNGFSAQDGDYFFYIFTGTDGDYISQTGSNGLSVGWKLQLDGWYATDANDYGIASLNIFDVNGVGLASIDSSPLYGADRDWSHFTIALDIPVGAASWEVILTGKKDGLGSWVDVHWDSMTLTAVPEPASILLLGTGLVILASVRRKKRA